MRQTLAPILLLLASLPGLLHANDRHESFISFHEGQSFIRQSGDSRELEGGVNLPLFAGDELRVTSRGRVEVRLADGNVIAVDRSSAIYFRSIGESYETGDQQTTVELLDGEVIVHRLARNSEALRLDTRNASYVSGRDTIYGVGRTGKGHDLVSVFEGQVEVRTPSGTSRVRAGEQVRVDYEGVYSSVALTRSGTTGFERWYLDRAGRWSDRRSSRYLSTSLSWASPELDLYGSWVYVNEYGSWVWRPRVSVGWRPYHQGYWRHSPSGRLVWVSHEPWGWVPYHYGRWAYSSIYGWVWLPGSGYSPAWVYWVYGPSYVGWVPAGWYDCYPRYYDWLYRPRVTVTAGFGFHGRVRVRDIELGAWTFVSPDGLMSNRIDRAALTTDAIRGRLNRDGGDSAVLTNLPARFDRDELRNPGEAIRQISRRGPGGGTGNGGSESIADATSFFRRDSELPDTVRQRIERVARGGTGSESPSGASERRPESSGDRGTISRRLGGEQSPSSEGRDAIRNRGGEREPGPRTIDRPSEERPVVSPRIGERVIRDEKPAEPSRDWRDAAAGRDRDESRRPAIEVPGTREESPSTERSPDWRRGIGRGGDGQRSERPREEPPGDQGERTRTAPERDDVPRRVIDRIGGVRVTPRAEEPTRAPAVERPSAPPPETRSSPPRSETSRSRGADRSRSSSGRVSTGSRSSSSSDSSSSSGSSDSRDGRVERDPNR